MKVRELIDLLEDYGDHLDVVVTRETDNRTYEYRIDAVEFSGAFSEPRVEVQVMTA